MSNLEPSRSYKGVVFDEGAVWLRKNERNEWELPGGKQEEGEQPEEAVARELLEELGFIVEVGDEVDKTLYRPDVLPDGSPGILVVSYSCELVQKVGDFEIWGEAGMAEFGKFFPHQIVDLTMPSFYMNAIKIALQNRTQQ